MSYGKPQSKGVKSDIRRVANIRHLTRIITYLSEVNKDSIKNISEKALVSSTKIKSAMVFLVNHKLVSKEKGLRRAKKGRGTMWYYKLNQRSKR